MCSVERYTVYSQLTLEDRLSLLTELGIPSLCVCLCVKSKKNRQNIYKTPRSVVYVYVVCGSSPEYYSSTMSL